MVLRIDADRGHLRQRENTVYCSRIIIHINACYFVSPSGRKERPGASIINVSAKYQACWSEWGLKLNRCYLSPLQGAESHSWGRDRDILTIGIVHVWCNYGRTLDLSNRSRSNPKASCSVCRIVEAVIIVSFSYVRIDTVLPNIQIMKQPEADTQRV